MCGIAGGFTFSEAGEKYLKNISAATACLLHRGPDGGGVCQSSNVALGHRRLSIIDTSESANQPMYSQNKRYSIVFNGEIFNFQELARAYLPGYSFVTTSDTEVFLELFIRKGAEAFSLLRGFFAAAIHDSEKNELYLVRDRFGKKPVHYYQDQDVLLFGSELRSLLSFGIPKELNREVLPFYFQLNYLPQPLSFIRGVQKLNPGHYLKITRQGVEQKRYYHLEVHREQYQRFSYEQAQRKLVELLDESTRLRLIADVPVGAFLSGGIDSSVVVALASRHKQMLNTFSIGYKDNPFFDETHYANLVAKKYRTNHTVFSLTNNDFLEHVDEVLNAIDEPFADSSTIPFYILSKETRKHVTVSLSGDGGDEIFAGYNKYNAEWNVMQPSFRKTVVRGLQPLWKILPKSRNNKLTNTFRQLHRFAEGSGMEANDRYWQWASLMSPNQSLGLFREGFNQIANQRIDSYFQWNISGTDLNEVLLADMNLVLVGDMLVKADMMSMANSLEVRSPFLDQEVVEFAFGLPQEYKINLTMKKRILQDAFRELLPAELYNRPKQGFDIPLLNWFRNELWSKIDNQLLSSAFLQEQQIFNPHRIQQIKNKLCSTNPGDSHEHIWALLVFQSWWKQYFS